MPTGVIRECTVMNSHKKVQLPCRVIARMSQYGAHDIGYQAAHSATGHPICLVEPLDGAKTAACDRRGAPVMRKNVLESCRLKGNR